MDNPDRPDNDNPGHPADNRPQRPLHVEVAVALGCMPTDGHHDAWYCGCSDHRHSAAANGDQPGGHAIARYDVDWRATGPLIEAFRLAVNPNPFDRESYDEAWSAEIEYPWPTDPAESNGLNAFAPSPIAAICELIIGAAARGALPTRAADTMPGRKVTPN